MKGLPWVALPGAKRSWLSPSVALVLILPSTLAGESRVPEVVRRFIVGAGELGFPAGFLGAAHSLVLSALGRRGRNH